MMREREGGGDWREEGGERSAYWMRGGVRMHGLSVWLLEGGPRAILDVKWMCLPANMKPRRQPHTRTHPQAEGPHMVARSRGMRAG